MNYPAANDGFSFKYAGTSNLQYMFTAVANFRDANGNLPDGIDTNLTKVYDEYSMWVYDPGTSAVSRLSYALSLQNENVQFGLGVYPHSGSAWDSRYCVRIGTNNYRGAIPNVSRPVNGEWRKLIIDCSDKDNGNITYKVEDDEGNVLLSYTDTAVQAFTKVNQIYFGYATYDTTTGVPWTYTEGHDSTNTAVYFDNLCISNKTAFAKGVNAVYENGTVTGSALDTGYDLSYNWLCSDTLDGSYTYIDGETGANFTPSADYSGKYVKLEVTASDNGSEGYKVRSNAVYIE
jgi:hypothetical protein